MHEDKRLKRYLVLQSFCPLFILILIKNAEGFKNIAFLIYGALQSDWQAVKMIFCSSVIGDILVLLGCLIWLLFTGLMSISLINYQNGGFDSRGEMITIVSEKGDSGVTFLVTFVLPLLADFKNYPWDYLFFCVLMLMVIVLLVKSDLFYQNPVLSALGYKVYEFRFKETSQDNMKDMRYIGISKNKLPVESGAIKRKYIADGVFYICNE